MAHKVIEVKDRAHLAAFIHFPWKVYKYEPNWVAPLVGEEYKLHNFNKHPFWKHAEAKYFLAVDKGQVLGRIAAIYDPNFISFQELNWGYWGFFECIHNQGVANSLFEAAANWLKNKGVEAAIGPMNPSTNYSCGLLVKGFDSPPVVMMTYNPKYYIELIEGYGMEKAKDLWAWIVDTPRIPERLEKLGNYALKKGGFTIRKVDFSKIDEEIRRIFGIYNKAWEKNWGFVPMTEAEFLHLAKELKMIADKDLVFIAEVDGKPVGFSLALPDVNQALIHIRSGRLFPFGIIKLLYYSKKINRLRVITMGVIEGYRNRGIDIAFYYYTFKEGLKKGYIAAECSWVLEDNVLMNKALEDIGAKMYKIYRIYMMKL